MLCPEELCVGPAAARVAVGVEASAELSVWTVEAAEKGARFLPWKGTVRSDKLAVYNKLPEFDVSLTCRLTGRLKPFVDLDLGWSAIWLVQ